MMNVDLRQIYENEGWSAAVEALLTQKMLCDFFAFVGIYEFFSKGKHKENFVHEGSIINANGEI